MRRDVIARRATLRSCATSVAATRARGRRLRVTVLAACLALASGVAVAGNLTVDTEVAHRFGVHEIRLRGAGRSPNPFLTRCTVEFEAPSGTSYSVAAFYDGGEVWKARLYVTEAGVWTWRSRSDEPDLDGRGSSFRAIESSLPGKLRKHDSDPKQWMTDDGRWFLNVSDTAYRLLNATVPEEAFRDYVREDAALGFTSLRCGGLGGWDWRRNSTFGGYDNSQWPWAGDDTSKFDLARFQATDRRLTYLLDNYPDMYVELIVFGLLDWRTDHTGAAWQALPERVRHRTLDYMIARWAAFPEVFWLIVNDLDLRDTRPANLAMAREVGAYLRAHDPWGSLATCGGERHQRIPFVTPSDRRWSTYIHLETEYSISGTPAELYATVPVHVFDAEDRYEHDYPDLEPLHPAYFYRRLMWSWLLSAGSANYGGRYLVVQPYSQTGRLTARIGDGYYTRRLVGADSLRYIKRFFVRTGVALVGWRPDDGKARDARSLPMWSRLRRLFGFDESRRVKCMVSPGGDAVLLYHPNAVEGFDEEGDPRIARNIDVDRRTTAAMDVDLSRSSRYFRVVWMRARDGELVEGDVVAGGAIRRLVAPWKGEDVVVYLSATQPDGPERPAGVSSEARDR